MSLISAIQTYIKAYTSLKSGAPVWVDYLGSSPVEYSIVPLPGTRVLESYITGATLRVYPFAFQSMESTADDLERLGTQGFFEAFADWLEQQTENGDLPILGAGQTADSIEAAGWGYLFQQGESETGVYQIQCALQYKQEPLEEESSS
ncbi:MAG: hypothetical protein JW908_04370 [Anaerolineales bacterium]|nr:hypothetical protein [Anaerolineales bacterium]